MVFSPFDGFQRDSGLEGRLKLFPHVRHFSPCLLVKKWQAKMHLNPLSSFRDQLKDYYKHDPQCTAKSNSSLRLLKNKFVHLRLRKRGES
jgi:hypothetical protein